MSLRASYISSLRLRLVPATTGLLEADLAGQHALSEALGVEVPESWPPELYERTALEWSLRQLQDPAERNWSTWYLVSSEDPPVLLGVCGFKGRPDDRGSVEIAYSVLPEARNAGIASEAVERLVSWAFTQPLVEEVCAETLPHLLQSIRVLEKNGFRLSGKGSESGVVRYAVDRSALT